MKATLIVQGFHSDGQIIDGNMAIRVRKFKILPVGSTISLKDKDELVLEDQKITSYFRVGGMKYGLLVDIEVSDSVRKVLLKKCVKGGTQTDYRYPKTLSF